MPCWHAPVLTILKVTLHGRQIFSMQSDKTPLFFASVESYRTSMLGELRLTPYSHSPGWHAINEYYHYKHIVHAVRLPGRSAQLTALAVNTAAHN